VGGMMGHLKRGGGSSCCKEVRLQDVAFVLFVAFPSDMKMASAAIEQVPREKTPPKAKAK